MNHLEELTLQWIDGSIGESGFAELERLLESDPLARQAHVEMCELEAALRSRLEPFDVTRPTMRRLRQVLRDGVPAARQGRQRPADENVEPLFELPDEWWSLDPMLRRSRRRIRTMRIGLALSVLLAVGVSAYHYFGTSSGVVLARIGQSDESVVIARDDEQITARTGISLLAGDAITVPSGSVASIRYDDGSRVVLGPNSQVTLQPGRRLSGEAKRFSLDHGSLTAHVARQPSGQSMFISTPTADVRVLGTRFALAADRAAARLDVMEGRVRVTRSDDRSTAEVSQGQFAIAAPGGELVVQALPPRVDEGLLALYRFDEGGGAVVKDVSGVGQPLDLHIDRPRAVRWLPGGGLHLHEPALVASNEPAKKIVDQCRQTGELTVEAWVRPTVARQDGPARIVTLSRDTVNRNFTLGHGGEVYNAKQETRDSYFIGRVRTTRTNPNGMPEVQSRSESLVVDLTHVVYTRTGDGLHRLYVDAVERVSDSRPGDFTSWNSEYRLALGDEFTRDRPWKGEYYLVAIFNRGLTADDVARNFRAGPGAALAD